MSGEEKTRFAIDGIPALLLGQPSPDVWLFLHGKCGCKEEAEAFASVACGHGAQVLGIDLPGHGARAGDGIPLTPFTVLPELKAVFSYLRAHFGTVSLRANSIGAWFAMQAFAGEKIQNALFVSPILDMEKLIRGMMAGAAVSEEDLRAAGELPTPFGETLSFRYLTYAKEHPVDAWHARTHLLYAGHDNLTSRETVTAFSRAHHAALTVMEEGEHWFHTEEQLAFLRDWEIQSVFQGQKSQRNEDEP